MTADATVVKETKYMAFIVLILSVLMQAVFLVLRKWDYTVLLGNLLTGILIVSNFYFMCLGIQRAVKCADEKEARRIIKNSQLLRNAVLYIIVIIGAVLPVFSTIAVIIPLFFTRIAIAMRQLWDNKEQKKGGLDSEAE